MEMQPKRKREKFLHEEDQKLRELVSIYGECSWDIISEKMPNRNQRQCRERWKHYLSGTKVKIPWTEEEDEVLFKKMSELGPKWTKIATFLNGRTDIQVKARWMQRFAMFSNLHLKKNRTPQKQNSDCSYHQQNNMQILPIQMNNISNVHEIDILKNNSQLIDYPQFENSSNIQHFDSFYFF